jgi:hypothetical protein
MKFWSSFGTACAPGVGEHGDENRDPPEKAKEGMQKQKAKGKKRTERRTTIFKKRQTSS